jgi:murein DD-endopeptidase MepM/ murein hydrolase activator NlpD
MKRFLALILALLAWSGQGLYADGFSAPAGSTNALATPDVTPEPFQWPVAIIINGHHVKVVSKFGHRKFPGVQSTSGTVPAAATGVDEVHDGIDFAVPVGSSVRVSRAGKVLFAGYSSAYVSRADKKDKNQLVIVRHADGKSTRYVHLDRPLRVHPGQEVKAGDVIGMSSASDEWTEPVVHFEIREANGKPVDPLTLLVDPQKAPAP